MSIKPIDMQVQVTKSQEVGKTQVNSDKFVQQEVFKHEMQKNADKKLNEVTKMEESNKLIDDNGHNKQEMKKSKHGNKNEDEKEDEKKHDIDLEEYNRQVTHRGTLFDFKA